jgi:hypothetical protein
LNRITFRDNWSVEFWILVALVLAALLIVVPWMIRHQLP